MNKTAIYSTIIASTIAVLSILAFSSSEVEAKPPSSAICPAENVQHWINYPVGLRMILQHSTEPSINPSFIFVQIPYTDSKLFSTANGPQQVADRLNELGYFVDDGGIRPVDVSDFNPLTSEVFDATYSTICAEN